MYIIDFLTTLKISTTLIIDSLDESKFFFDQEDPTFRTLQVFVASVTNDEVLNLALGNWGGVALSNSLSFFIFIPVMKNISIDLSWTRRDKIPIIDLQWTYLHLTNYVDYIFDYLRTQSAGKCERLPDICSLLGGTELCMNVMERLRHPRDFHIFFSVLLEHMKGVCTQRKPPFIATKADIEKVLERTKPNLLDETK